jgi:hypothetical protein
MFTAAYIGKFNEAKRREREKRKANAALRPKASGAAGRNVLMGYDKSRATHDDVTGSPGEAHRPFGIEAGCGFGFRQTATDIAQSLGVYSKTCRPHGHAVAAIIGKLNPDPKHIEAASCGPFGITMRYDADVLHMADEWIFDNAFPRDIPHLGFAYHVYYRDLGEVPSPRRRARDGGFFGIE